MRKRLLSLLIIGSTLALVAGASSSADPHTDALREAMGADLVGVWSTANSFVWLYDDHTMKTLTQNCFLKGTGTWRFEYGNLMLYVGDKEVFFRVILSVPTKPMAGDKMVLDTTAEWMFMSPDTDEEC